MASGYPGKPPFSSNAQAAIAALEHRMVLDLAQGVRDAAAKGLRGYNNRIPKLASAIAISSRDSAAIARANQDIAEVMHARVRKAFETRVMGRKRVASYRVGRGRYAGGALKHAINSPSMVRGDARGIHYIDQELLNRVAKQWARLNFGAGAAGQQTVQRKMYDLRFGGGKGDPNRGGTRLKKIGLGNLYGARPAFFMPIGLWVEAGGYPTTRSSGSASFTSGTRGRRRFKNAKGQWVGRSATGDLSSYNRNADNRRGGRGRFRRRSNDQFFPTSGTRFWPKPTIGIRAANFFNDGFEALEKEFPRRYKRLFDQWVKAGKAQGKAIRKTMPVKSGRQ